MASIEERLTAIEARLGMESGLRAAMDTDLASVVQNIRVNNHLIQAVALTQSEHGERLSRLETGQQEIRTGMGEMRTGMGEITRLLTILINEKSPEKE